MPARFCLAILFCASALEGGTLSLPALRLAPLWDWPADPAVASDMAGGSGQPGRGADGKAESERPERLQRRKASAQETPRSEERSSDVLPASCYRLRAAGPLFSVDEAMWPSGQRVSALPRPLLVHFRDEQAETTGLDSFWPLAVHRRRPERRHTRLALAYWSREGAKGDEAVRTRWGIPPFLWGGRVPESGRYFGLFPLGGILHEFGGYDHIRFALFPLYLNTLRAGQRRHALLWPVFSLTRESGQLRKWRVFPLVGGAYRETGRQHFALWPLLHRMRVETPTGRIRRGSAVLPFYGQLTEWDPELEEQTFWSRTVLWPFFSGAKGRGVTRLHLAWPFYQYKAVRDGGEIVYRKQFFWPLFGARERPGEQYGFAAWPFCHRWRIDSGDGVRKTQRFVFPFYWSSVVRERGEVTRSQQLFWPLLRRERRGDRSRTSALALWPQRNAAPVRRNYAPFWTLYECRSDARGRSQEILWGAWQYREERCADEDGDGEIKRVRFRLFPFLDAQREGDTYSVSVLKGLLTVTNAPDKRNRLLWLLPW